jgi:hypothetical protein
MKAKKREKLLIATIGLFLILAVMLGTAYAVPMLINYQGFLTDDTGAPLDSPPTISMTFTIWDDPDTGEGSSLWTETHGSVSVSNGIFSVVLGSSTALTASVFNGDCYLGVEVESDGEMTPRQQLTSVAYSIIAGVAQGVEDNSINSADIVNESVASADILDGSVASADIQDGATLAEILDDDGSGSLLDADTVDGKHASAFMSYSTDNWVDTTGDTMTGALDVNADINTSGVYKIGGSTAFTASSNKTVVGVSAGHTTTGADNTFVGNNAGQLNNTGYSNTFIGTFAGYWNILGFNNTYVGRSAGFYNQTGDYNTIIGYMAGLGEATSGFNRNVFLGYQAGFKDTSGGYNTMLGMYAGYGNTTGDNNTMIGYWTGGNNTGSGNVFLGYTAGSLETTTSNQLFIDNSNTREPLIHGDFTDGSEKVTINGDLTVTGELKFPASFPEYYEVSAATSTEQSVVTDPHSFCALGKVQILVTSLVGTNRWCRILPVKGCSYQITR